MDLRELVEALIARDALSARQWAADAARGALIWTNIPRPVGWNALELAVAAGVVELFASRSRQAPPSWTATIGSAPDPVYLVRAAETMPRLRRSCETEGPEPLRVRRIYAPPDFLTAA
jgi:hypothetical protein